MSFFNILFITTCAFTNIASWTIDLPEVRQFYFAKYSKGGDETPVHLKDGEVFYNNYYSNSKHNEHNPGYIGPIELEDHPGMFQAEDVSEGQSYAKQYEYQSYMEKKVHNIVSQGSRYLEGLRRAVQQYAVKLQNCTNMNYTTLVASGSWQSCREATARSEHVRRLTQLALHTTRELQERTSADTHEEDTEEEHALLLRLAWLLDQLTSATGFEPDPEHHLTTTQAPTSTPPAVKRLPIELEVPEDVKLFLMRCLQNASSEQPATHRCRYPLPLPEPVRRLLNITDDATSPSPESTQVTATTPDVVTTGAVKSIRKRSATDSPIATFINYFAKYKAWSNENPETHLVSNREYDDKNHLVKRSIDIRLPEDPMQDISALLVHRASAHFHPDKKQLEKIKQYLTKLHETTPSKNRLKRSAGKRLRLRIPEDPMQDISYYVKHKRGTETAANPVQAAQVRLGLEQVFQTGNIEVVRRYGSNYNPAIRDHVDTGLTQILVDS